MSKTRILDARVEIGAGGGPIPSLVVGEVHLRSSKGQAYYVTLSEYDGMASFYLTDQSVLEPLAEAEDEELLETLNEEHLLAAGEYEDLFAQPDEQWHQVFRYLIYLVRCENEEVQPFLDVTVGNFMEDMDIPLSDVEEDFMGIS